MPEEILWNGHNYDIGTQDSWNSQLQIEENLIRFGK